MNKQPELVINIYGTKLWYLDGKLHREDGPAIEFPDGYKEWYLNDEIFLKEEWFKRLTPEQQENYLWNLDE